MKLEIEICQNFCKQNLINIEVNIEVNIEISSFIHFKGYGDNKVKKSPTLYNQSYFILCSYRKDMSKRGAKEQARGGKRLSSEESKDTSPHIVYKHKYTQTIPIFALIFVVPSPLPGFVRSLHIHIR